MKNFSKIYPSFLFFLFISLLTNTFSIIRDLSYSEEKCIIKNFYSKSNIIITFNITEGNIKSSKNEEPKFVINIYNKKTNKLINNFISNKTYGKFSFNIEKTSNYKICILCKDKTIFEEQKSILFDFNVESSLDVEQKGNEVADWKDFDKVNKKMEYINDKIDQIESMQMYSNQIENSFSKNQIKTSKRVVQISLIQVAIVLAVGIYHIYSLKKIYNSKFPL